MQVLNANENFLAIEEEFSNYKDSHIVILQVPYEHTVSYGGGTSKAPAAILSASAFVEFYDEEFDSELCFSEKIATLPALDLTDSVDAAMLSKVENSVDVLLADGKFVVTLGGEHTISIAPIKSHSKKHPSMSVLHFDAHSDLRQSYQNSLYSHACFMARVAEFLPAKHITQVGIRALCKEEREFIEMQQVNTFFASGIRNGRHGQNWQKAIVDTLQQEVYITFDVDFFDPAIMPTTGTPEPNGFLYHETMEIFRLIAQSGRKIIGFDVVELAPVNNVQHTDLTIARLIYKMLNIAFNLKQLVNSKYFL